MEKFSSMVIIFGELRVSCLLLWKSLSNIEVYEFKNGNVTFKENAAAYDHDKFNEQAPLFLVNENFCTWNHFLYFIQKSRFIFI